MKTLEITRLELVGFGKFRERTIDLTGGLNLIEGPNEAGKSTIQSFITGMFYGFFQPGTKRRSYTPHRDKYVRGTREAIAACWCAKMRSAAGVSSGALTRTTKRSTSMTTRPGMI